MAPEPGDKLLFLRYVRTFIMTMLTFLGTGGGRFVTLMQERSTGGIYLEDKVKVHIDPGPGALHALKRNRIDPTQTDCIAVSHCHPDHYANAEVLIEGMSFGKKGRAGALFAPRSVITGSEKVGPAISRYHQGKLREIVVAKPFDRFRLGDLEMMATPAVHSDPDCIGMRFVTTNGDVSYVADTEMREEVIEAHKGARVLVLATTRPLRSRIPFHLSTEDAARFASVIRPELCVLTHLGRRFLRESPKKQAEWVKARTGVETVAARDDMKVTMGPRVEVLYMTKPGSYVIKGAHKHRQDAACPDREKGPPMAEPPPPQVGGPA